MKLSEKQSALFLAFLSLARPRGVPSRVLSRAIDRVGRGPDGSLRFKNSLRYIRLAMAPQVPLVPSWKKLTRQAVVLMGHLFDQLQRALIDQKPASELQAIRKQIEDLGNEVRVAGVVLGLLAPWKPRKGRKSGVIRLGPWTEDLHPRGDGGRFTHSVDASYHRGLAMSMVAPLNDGSLSREELLDDIHKHGGDHKTKFAAFEKAGDRWVRDVHFDSKEEIADALQDNEIRTLSLHDAFRDTALPGESFHDWSKRRQTLYRTGSPHGRFASFSTSRDRSKQASGSASNDDEMVLHEPPVAWMGALRGAGEVLIDPEFLHGHRIREVPVSVAPNAEAVAPEFIPHRTSKHRPKDYVTVVADSKRLETELAKAPSSYIPPGGVGSTEEITPGRLARFREFLQTGKPVEQPDAVWADSGMVALNDGRHRTRVLIDSGLKTIPLTVHKRDAAKVEEAVGRQGLLFGPSKRVKWRFPWIQAAIDFLSAKKVIPASAFAGLSLDEQQAAFTAPGIEDPSELRKLRDEIAGGVKEGESYANFQKRVGDGLALTRAQTETVFRTNIHQGYVGGFEQGTEAPAVVDAFPAVMLSATRDNRVRETHWELDGFCCLKTDPAYQVLLRALKDWNCRCNPIPMSLKQAEAVGLKTFKDLPEEVVKKYGAGLAPAAV